MQRVCSIICLIFIAVLMSCKSSGPGKKQTQPWHELPQVTSIDKLQETEFVLTLENPISKTKNIVYAPAFLFAWDKLRQELKEQIILSAANSPDFQLINQSTSFRNSLKDSEYSVNVEIVGTDIIARAFFNKTLPFPSKLQKLDSPILFNQTKIAAFGMDHFDEEAITFTQILYYKDDDHFILRLTPKDNQHEINLVKGTGDATSLSEILKTTTNLIAIGNNERAAPKSSWKYLFNPDDIFSIPVIKFNIAANYKSLEGQVFQTKRKTYFIDTAYQRTGFILNENGAVVESEAVIMAKPTDPGETEPIIIHPKKMVFDKPFVIFVKHTGSDNPYFVMKIENAELLIKQ